MRNSLIALIFLALAAIGRADEAVAEAQQILKDHGFYYGEITGQKDADTTAAVRRYQIRNGLQINGELNEETLRSLHTAPSSAPAASAPPIAPVNPPPRPDTSDLRDRTSNTVPEPNAPSQSIYPPPVPSGPSVSGQDRQIYPSNPVDVPPPIGNLFVGTPYQNSPPDVRRDVLASVQDALASKDLYHGGIDGVYGPKIEFSLRAYQSRVGLAVTGRPDLETLAALELLPGAHTPVYTGRRWWQSGRPVGPPVRGEWVRPP
jgi:peptidoglycan hydrolase-like protein with peptidoglycan-binding domain